MNHRVHRSLLTLMALLLPALALLGGCAAPGGGTGKTTSTAPNATDAPTPGRALGHVLGRSARLLIYQSRIDESLPDIAQRFLGSPDLAWMIRERNPGITHTAPAGKPLVVPLVPLNTTGVYKDRHQTVPILCYHRFAPGGRSKAHPAKMTVGTDEFAAQLDWLARNGFHVIRLAELQTWLDGKAALPARAVVITADDGYASFYRHAYPLLKKHGFPATVFVYTDFIGAGDAVSWRDMKAMVDSGLIDVQAHSRTHRNLLDRFSGESQEHYQQMLESETRGARDVLARRLGNVQRHFAYPYGDANQAVLDTLVRQGVSLGLTVTPGGNPFFAQPLMLRRTMIYGDMSLDDFKARLQVSRLSTLQ